MKYLKIIPVLCVFFILMTGEIFAYVIPLEQILGEVRKKFLNLNTLIIEQATHVIQSRNPLRETIFREKVWLKTPQHEQTLALTAPDIANTRKETSKTKPGPEKEALNTDIQKSRQPNRDAAFRWLLMANPKGGMAAFLSRLGIQIQDIQDVGYDRCDGIVAYRVGARDAEGPRLLVDKERFLPLLLSYIMPGASEDRRVTVRFKDYRKIDSGWYPYEIVYALKDGPTEVYHVLALTENPPIQAAVFERETEAAAIPPKPPLPMEQTGHQRLEEIRRALKK